MPGRTGTGGNTEPMPFRRTFGNSDSQQSETPPPEENADVLPQIDEEKSERRRSRDKSDGSKHRKRSRSRERARKHKRSRSRERSSRRRRSRSPRDRSNPNGSDNENYSRQMLPPTSTFTAPAIGIVTPLLASASAPAPDERQRKRKSRWSEGKSFVPGMPTVLPSNLSEEQRKAYLLQLEIEEGTRRLRLGDFLMADGPNRSPSPEPVYDSHGKRLNTREIRKRQELEQSRHEKIQQLLKVNPHFRPPADYKQPNIKLNDRVWIPQDEHPEINFVGLLIGPRGNTLKSLEKETGAKIIIRGKGSVKEGKLGRREGPMPGENEPLHAYVTSTDSEIIKKACEKIRSIINQALEIPDGQNELRKLQLRELALLNGTLRPEDLVSGARCSNCGSEEHKTWECPDAPNVTANIICTACGAAGHIARDCKNPRPGFVTGVDSGLDDEYSALMAELGENSGQKGKLGTGLSSTQPIMRVNLSKPQKPPSLMSMDPNNPPPWGSWPMTDSTGEYGQRAPFPPHYQAMMGAPPTEMWPPWPMPVPPPSSSASMTMPPPPPPPDMDLSTLLTPPAPPPPPE